MFGGVGGEQAVPLVRGLEGSSLKVLGMALGMDKFSINLILMDINLILMDISCIFTEPRTPSLGLVSPLSP